MSADFDVQHPVAIKQGYHLRIQLKPGSVSLDDMQGEDGGSEILR